MTDFQIMQQKFYEYREEAIRHFGGLIPEMEDYVNALEEREKALEQLNKDKDDKIIELKKVVSEYFNKHQSSEELLKKYIRYVFEAEGSDNIRYGKDYGADTEFTEEEWEKLKNFAIEVNGEAT